MNNKSNHKIKGNYRDSLISQYFFFEITVQKNKTSPKRERNKQKSCEKGEVELGVGICFF